MHTQIPGTDYTYRQCDFKFVFMGILTLPVLICDAILAAVFGSHLVWFGWLPIVFVNFLFIFILSNTCYMEYKDVDGVFFEVSYQPFHCLWGKCAFKYEDILSIKICHNAYEGVVAYTTDHGKIEFEYVQGFGEWIKDNVQHHIFIRQKLPCCRSRCNENNCPRYCNCAPYDPMNPKSHEKVLKIELKKNEEKEILRGCGCGKNIEFDTIMFQCYDYIRFKQFIENKRGIEIEDTMQLLVNSE